MLSYIHEHLLSFIRQYHIDLDRCIEKDGSGKRKKSGAKLRAEKSLEDLDQIELAVYRTLFGSAVSAVVAVAEEG